METTLENCFKASPMTTENSLIFSLNQPLLSMNFLIAGHNLQLSVQNIQQCLGSARVYDDIEALREWLRLHSGHNLSCPLSVYHIFIKSLVSCSWIRSSHHNFYLNFFANFLYMRLGYVVKKLQVCNSKQFREWLKQEPSSMELLFRYSNYFGSIV